MRLNLASAAIGYYYNRVVESQWARTREAARKTQGDFEQGRKWADVIVGADRAASRARLYYARAQVFLQATTASARTPADAERIKADFSELVKLTPDEMAAYPYPWHIARAGVNVADNAEDIENFAKLEIGKLSRQLGSKTVKFDDAIYEAGLKTAPNATEIAQLGENDKIRVLMHFIPNANNKRTPGTSCGARPGSGGSRFRTSRPDAGARTDWRPRPCVRKRKSPAERGLS